MKALRAASEPATREILRHWQEAVPNDRLAHLVKHAARSFARALQMRLAEHSVSYGHWSFLRILWESEGLTQRQLSGQAGVMEPTTFSALNAMERLGYVVRKPSPTSRKEIHVYLTRRGRGLKNKLVPLAEEVNEVALREVATADIAATRRTLLAFIENLAADEMGSLTTRRRIPSTRELSRLLNGSGRRARNLCRVGARAPPSERQSTLMLASRTIFAHLGTSTLIRAANSSGVVPIGSKPIAANFSFTSGSAMIRRISRWRRSTIALEVPAGTSTHCGVSPSCPG